MPFELREKSGFIFRTKGVTNEKQPQWRGECLIDGVAHEVVMWNRETERAGRHFSFKIGPARGPAREQADSPHPYGDQPNPGDRDDW